MDPLAEYLVSRPVARGIGGFADGVKAPWDGYLYLRGHRKLFRYTAVPLLIHLVLTLATLSGVVYAALHVFAEMDRSFPQGWTWGILEILFDIGAGVLLLALGAAVSLALGLILCSFFYDRLTREVERALGLSEQEMKEVPLWRNIVDSLRNLGEIAVITVSGFMLSFIPGIGLAVPWVTFLLNAFLFGVEYLDFPLALRGWKRSQKRAFARSHRGAVTGLGAVVFLFNIVPVVGSFFLAPAVVGAILLNRRLQPK